jgi:Na+-translocating ferredoxin:NAD+ oxidoreductase RnfD subunit
MAKYRFIGDPKKYGHLFSKYAIYGENYNALANKVKNIASAFPKDWQLIEEPNNSFKTIYNSLLQMQEAKDKAYGNSALKPLDIFAKHHNYGARLDEKLSRVQNSSELRKNDVADIIGGLVLICKDKGWTNFDDLID